MERTNSVEMSLAYVWNCETCGAENFERAVVYEFSPEELSYSDESDPPETGDWMTHPDHVKCKACGAEFLARHFRSEGDALIEQDGE
jgi:hypothetical protein